jgi:hypothetical protein
MKAFFRLPWLAKASALVEMSYFVMSCLFARALKKIEDFFEKENN